MDEELRITPGTTDMLVMASNAIHYQYGYASYGIRIHPVTKDMLGTVSNATSPEDGGKCRLTMIERDTTSKCQGHCCVLLAMCCSSGGPDLSRTGRWDRAQQNHTRSRSGKFYNGRWLLDTWKRETESIISL